MTPPNDTKSALAVPGLNDLPPVVKLKVVFDPSNWDCRSSSLIKLPDVGIVSGTKDAVHSEDNLDLGVKAGDPIHQGIDYSKLVPLLTAALQEEIAKRETLEARIDALEG